MGIDVQMGLTEPPTPDEHERLAPLFRDAFPSTSTMREYPYLDARGQVQTLDRYYGPGYERGPWPRIRSMIEWLWEHTDGADVRYGGDVVDFDELPIVTREDIEAIQQHYDSVGHEPYRAAFRS